MKRPYRHLEIQRQGDVHCVRMRRQYLDEGQLQEMCSELLRLVDEDGCRKLILHLGPPDLEFLYSIFLAKLVSLQRRLNAAGGELVLASASSATRSIFTACRLDTLFHFAPDEEAALTELTKNEQGA